MNKQIESLIARLENVNRSLKQLLEAFQADLTQEEVDEILDEISKNLRVITKLRGDDEHQTTVE